MGLKWQDDQDYVTLVEDLLETPEVQSLSSYVHHTYTNRLEHSLTVSYRSYRLARLFGLDYRETARASLLHDLFYYDMCDSKDVGPKGHLYEHPRIALKNALKLTQLSDLGRDIILKHMWGATLDVPKYAESWIVTLMDKEAAILEVTRGMGGSCRRAANHYCHLVWSIMWGHLAFWRHSIDDQA